MQELQCYMEVNMCIKCNIVTLSTKIDDLEPELKRVAKLIYDGKLKPGQIDPKMVRKIAAQLIKAIKTGYTMPELITDTEKSFVARLEANIWDFTGFKNYNQLLESGKLLSDGKGSYKSFHEFFEDVKIIDKTYNEIYAEAEYDTCLASAQSASSWHSYITNGIRVLTFRTVGDDVVRPQHKIYDGLTVSIDDPILNTHATPLGFRCRCEWEPGDEENITTGEQWIASKKKSGEISPNEDEIKLPKMFENNVGKTAQIFPDSHPYFDVDKKTADSIKKQVGKIKKEDKNG